MTRRAFLDFFAPRISISKADSVSHMLRRERVLHAKLPETVENHRPLSKTRLNTPKFSMFSEHLIDVQKQCMHLEHIPSHSVTYLKAFSNLPETFVKRSTFHEHPNFLVSWKKLCRKRNLSTAHSQTQHVHSGISLDLNLWEKLVRSRFWDILNFVIFFITFWQAFLNSISPAPVLL